MTMTKKEQAFYLLLEQKQAEIGSNLIPANPFSLKEIQDSGLTCMDIADVSKSMISRGILVRTVVNRINHYKVLSRSAIASNIPTVMNDKLAA